MKKFSLFLLAMAVSAGMMAQSVYHENGQIVIVRDHQKWNLNGQNL